jgi:hypothetical protein
MNLDTPHLILYAIAAIALVVWLLGLRFLLQVGRDTARPADAWADEDELAAAPDGEASAQATIRGAADVAGRPAELAAKAAAHLALHGAAALGPVRILEQTDERVAFESAPHLGGQFVRRGLLEFHAAANERTQIDYAVSVPRRTGLLAAAWIMQILGLIVLVVGLPAMLLWVASHPNPAIRWQSVQMLHVMHFLWPPFLFAALYRRVQNHVRNTLDSLIHNLPYLQG